VPLICYVVWDAIIMGVLPLEGSHGLIAILHSNNSTSDLVNNISATAAHNSITFFIKLFTSICVLTSFLGASLCMVDFLADGIELEKSGISGFFIHILAFLPPLVIVLFFPNAFIKALQYAGIYCVILLIFLPAWMAWSGRSKGFTNGFTVPGGKTLLAILMIFSLALIVQGVIG
jgi:tyrosine-specific transport protein